MEKIVKHCAICEESFIEEFSFCPKCSASLSINKRDVNLTDTQTYQITFVDEKKNKMQQSLLFGAFLAVMSGSVFALVLSIYNSDAYVSALDEESVFNIASPLIEPIQLEKLDLPESNDDKEGGGGGGGGRKDKTEVSKGELPPQFVEKPLLTPSKEDISVSNPTITVFKGTKGPNDIIPEKKNSTNGSPISKFEVPSDGYSDENSGMGKDGKGGIGSNGRDGVGRDGIGGRGNSEGDTYGDKIGVSSGKPKPMAETDEEPPKTQKTVLTALKIIDKPRAIYTNQARKNQIAGTVTLRVTFLASGQIGNIAVVSGLPDGLTEQAIVAAKNIKFEPAKSNGISQNVTRQVQYTFTLY